MKRDIWDLVAAITMTIGTIILIVLTVMFWMNGNTRDAIGSTVGTSIVGIVTIALWIKFVFEL